jgi:hypothetical protein
MTKKLIDPAVHEHNLFPSVVTIDSLVLHILMSTPALLPHQKIMVPTITLTRLLSQRGGWLRGAGCNPAQPSAAGLTSHRATGVLSRAAVPMEVMSAS